MAAAAAKHAHMLWVFVCVRAYNVRPTSTRRFELDAVRAVDRVRVATIAGIVSEKGTGEHRVR